MAKKKMIIGTRGSALALYQAEEVRRLLLEAHQELEVELKVIKTKGDKFLQMSLDASGDKGLFTKEIERELLEGNIDIAVHSLKDLPVEPAPQTKLGAILPREQANDVLLGDYTLATLPKGAIVGTSSPRRAEQLKRLRQDLDIRPIRGNVQTRIAKMKAGEYDAIVMAYAGLKRLGLEAEVSQVFTTEEIVPAAGQAAIAVQMRADDEQVETLLAPIHCENTAFEVNTERAVLSHLGGGCAMPFGCRCELLDLDMISLTAYYGNSKRGVTTSFECPMNELEGRLESLIETLQNI